MEKITSLQRVKLSNQIFTILEDLRDQEITRYEALALIMESISELLDSLENE